MVDDHCSSSERTVMLENRPVAAPPHRDWAAGLLGWGFVATLLVSEAALTLPDATASGAAVVEFYASHRLAVIVIQVIGFAAATLLALLVRQLRGLGRPVTVTGIAVAVVALTPGLLTVALATVTDQQRADTFNQWLPRTDDVLFLAIIAFAVAVAVRLWRSPTWLAALATATALLGVTRLVLEAAGTAEGVLSSLAPIAFLVLIATLATVAWRRPLVPEPGP
jgi:hypothetical protein